jgi:hypothetical protein
MADDVDTSGNAPGDALEDHTTLSDVQKTFSKTMDLKSNYSRSWKARDAFRELVQNW